MDISTMNLDIPSILIHVLNILLDISVAAVICILIAKFRRKQRSKA